MSDQVLFLCTGNTCRSPLAEIIARDLMNGPVPGFGSAGLQAGSGQPASAESVAVAQRMGLDLSAHRARIVCPDMLQATRWVIGMTRSHAAIFRSRFRGHYTGAVGVLGLPGVDLAGSNYSPGAEEVDDPYGSGPADYQAVGAQIQRLLSAWDQVFRNLKGTDA